jgi:DNA repair metallo-beta-lactamase
MLQLTARIRRGNKFIKITPTGWANIKEYISMGEGEYIVPYSSHSNYREIEMFVGSIRPAVLKCVVREHRSNYQKISNVKQFNSYMFTLQSLKQTGYERLVKSFTKLETASQEYRDLMDPKMQTYYEDLLGLKITEEKRKEEDCRRFDQSMTQILNARNKKKLSKGIRLVAPEDNEELTKEDLKINEENSRQRQSDMSRLIAEESSTLTHGNGKLDVVAIGVESKFGEPLDDRLEKRIKTEMYSDPSLTGIKNRFKDEADSDEEQELAQRRAFLAVKAQEKSLYGVAKAQPPKDDFDEEFS